MPTPAERKVARIPFVGRPIKKGLQLSRLAQKERIRHSARYAVDPGLLTRGGKSGIEEYSRRVEAARKRKQTLSRRRIIERSRKINPKRLTKK